MSNLRSIAWAGMLALALALVGCGQADTDASLTITSVPQAEVFVDGVSQGTSGQAIALPAGDHKVEFRAEGFKTLELSVSLEGGETKPLEALLEPLDPSSPTVVASLMQSEGLEVAPWVAPETTRGRSGKQSVAVLLWPSKDVRENGLVNFAIEAGETYEGDASLEFRAGRKVLFREKFSPESITSVRPIPAEVLEHVKVNSKITWGLYFEDRRRPIKTTFKVVRRPNAERQLERLRKSRHMKRQPAITRAIAEAVVLENNRLYSEALVANLQIANDHPRSSQPFRGIITTLRRLDAESSELFATISPHVSGKGQSGVSARGSGLGISAWSPVQKGSLPTPTVTADAGTAKPNAQGVTPTGGADRPADGTEPTAEAPGSKVAEPSRVDEVKLQQRITEMTAAAEEANARAAEVEASVDEANAAAAAAEGAASQAEAEAATARAAVENATDPTPEQHDAMREAGQRAEEAREAAAAAKQAAVDAAKALSEVRKEADALNSEIADMQRLLDAAKGPTEETIPGAAPEPTESKEAQGPNAAEMQDMMSAAQTIHDEASARVEAAEKALADAKKALADNPSEANEAAVASAHEARDTALTDLDKASRDLESARAALDAFKAREPESKAQPIK